MQASHWLVYAHVGPLRHVHRPDLAPSGISHASLVKPVKPCPVNSCSPVDVIPGWEDAVLYQVNADVMIGGRWHKRLY